MSDQFDAPKTGAQFPDATGNTALRIALSPSGAVTFSSGPHRITIPTEQRAAMALTILGVPEETDVATDLAANVDDDQRNEFVESARECLYAALVQPAEPEPVDPVLAENIALRTIVQNIGTYLQQAVNDLGKQDDVGCDH